MNAGSIDELLGTHSLRIDITSETNNHIKGFRFPTDSLNGNVKLWTEKVIVTDTLYSTASLEAMTRNGRKKVPKKFFDGFAGRNQVWYAKVDNEIMIPGREALRILGYGAPKYKSTRGEKGRTTKPRITYDSLKDDFGLNPDDISFLINRGILHQVHLRTTASPDPDVYAEDVRRIYESVAQRPLRGLIPTRERSKYYLGEGDNRKPLETSRSLGIPLEDARKFFDSATTKPITYDVFAWHSKTNKTGVMFYVAPDLGAGTDFQGRSVFDNLNDALGISEEGGRRYDLVGAAHCIYEPSPLMGGTEVKWFVGAYNTLNITSTRKFLTDIGIEVKEAPETGPSPDTHLKLKRAVDYVKKLESPITINTRALNNPVLTYFQDLFEHFNKGYERHYLARSNAKIVNEAKK